LRADRSDADRGARRHGDALTTARDGQRVRHHVRRAIAGMRRSSGESPAKTRGRPPAHAVVERARRRRRWRAAELDQLVKEIPRWGPPARLIAIARKCAAKCGRQSSLPPGRRPVRRHTTIAKQADHTAGKSIFLRADASQPRRTKAADLQHRGRRWAGISCARLERMMPAISRKRADTATEVYVEELRRYFESSKPGVRSIAEGLQEITFGEFLVEQGVLDRYQLFRALQLQDRSPGTRLGECAAALGFAPINAIERFFERYVRLQTVIVA
jgi:hypothetical protein